MARAANTFTRTAPPGWRVRRRIPLPPPNPRTLRRSPGTPATSGRDCRAAVSGSGLGQLLRRMHAASYCDTAAPELALLSEAVPELPA